MTKSMPDVYQAVYYAQSLNKIRRQQIINWLRVQQSENGLSVADTMPYSSGVDAMVDGWLNDAMKGDSDGI